VAIVDYIAEKGSVCYHPIGSDIFVDLELKSDGYSALGRNLT
jgi:hypothetical protein